jgi:hypothetical protein
MDIRTITSIVSESTYVSKVECGHSSPLATAYPANGMDQNVPNGTPTTEIRRPTVFRRDELP